MKVSVSRLFLYPQASVCLAVVTFQYLLDVALAVQPPERDKQGVGGGIPERSALAGAEVRPRPLQRDGVERRRGGAETHQERCRQPVGKRSTST